GENVADGWIAPELRGGERTRHGELRVRLACPRNRLIEQFPTDAASAERFVDLGVIDDHVRATDPAVGHFRETPAFLLVVERTTIVVVLAAECSGQYAFRLQPEPHPMNGVATCRA